MGMPGFPGLNGIPVSVPVGLLCPLLVDTLLFTPVTCPPSSVTPLCHMTWWEGHLWTPCGW